MAMIYDLAEYLETNSIGTRATNLFVGVLPPSPDNAVMIDQTGGTSPDVELPVAQPSVQVTARNTDATAGLAKIQAVYDLLHKKNDLTVLKSGGVDVMTIFAMQEPTHIGQDENERHIFTCNFLIKKRT